MTTTEVSNSLERVDGIINMLDEICDHMDGFSSAEEAWLSSITETLRTWRYVMRETYEGPEGICRRSPRSLWVHLDQQMLGYRTRAWAGSPLIVIALLLCR